MAWIECIFQLIGIIGTASQIVTESVFSSHIKISCVHRKTDVTESIEQSFVFVLENPSLTVLIDDWNLNLFPGSTGPKNSWTSFCFYRPNRKIIFISLIFSQYPRCRFPQSYTVCAFVSFWIIFRNLWNFSTFSVISRVSNIWALRLSSARHKAVGKHCLV